MRYLYGPGKAEEHRDPHIVASWTGETSSLEPAVTGPGRRDFRRLIGLLEAPLAAQHEWLRPDLPVYHLVSRASPEDRILSDAEWAALATEMMHNIGLSRRDELDAGVRWIAVRHADDHIHIVATLARQDGRIARRDNDYYRVRDTCRIFEQRYRLRRTAPAVLLRRLLDRRTPGPDLRPAVPGGLRRDRGGRPRPGLLAHHGPGRGDPQRGRARLAGRKALGRHGARAYPMDGGEADYLRTRGRAPVSSGNQPIDLGTEQVLEARPILPLVRRIAVRREEAGDRGLGGSLREHPEILPGESQGGPGPFLVRPEAASSVTRTLG